MKVWAAIAFLGFMSVSVYVLLNEKSKIANHPKAENISVSRAKRIGEIHRDKLRPNELQRQRIDETTIYRFESLEKNNSFEMDEDDMNEFAESFKALDAVKNTGRIEIEPTFEIFNKEEKEYYEE